MYEHLRLALLNRQCRKRVDLNMGWFGVVRGHSRSLKIAQFHGVLTSSN